MVAEAHVRAYEAMGHNTAGKRYIFYDHVIQSAQEFAELERQLGIPSRRAATQSVDDDRSARKATRRARGGAARVVPRLRVVRCMAASDAAQLKSVWEDIKEILKTTYCHSILAAARRRVHGPNELLDHLGQSVLQLVAQQFEDTLVRIPLAGRRSSRRFAFRRGHARPFEPQIIFLISSLTPPRGLTRHQRREGAEAPAIESDHAARVPRRRKGDCVPGMSPWSAGTRSPPTCVPVLVSSNLRVEG
ncbi:hypothetical protein ZWY2020_001363 [Hordeum vulgare]|nr:hypothetical protein ZWY2020_001363 [Hordeum vulgare]